MEWGTESSWCVCRGVSGDCSAYIFLLDDVVISVCTLFWMLLAAPKASPKRTSGIGSPGSTHQARNIARTQLTRSRERPDGSSLDREFRNRFALARSLGSRFPFDCGMSESQCATNDSNTYLRNSWRVSCNLGLCSGLIYDSGSISLFHREHQGIVVELFHCCKRIRLL